MIIRFLLLFPMIITIRLIFFRRIDSLFLKFFIEKILWNYSCMARENHFINFTIPRNKMLKLHLRRLKYATRFNEINDTILLIRSNHFIRFEDHFGNTQIWEVWYQLNHTFKAFGTLGSYGKVQRCIAIIIWSDNLQRQTSVRLFYLIILFHKYIFIMDNLHHLIAWGKVVKHWVTINDHV